MIEDLFDLIGGRSAIEAATELFYDKVLHDDSLRHFFETPPVPTGYVHFHAPRQLPALSTMKDA